MDYLYQLLEMLHIKKNVGDNNFKSLKKPSGYKNINSSSIRMK